MTGASPAAAAQPGWVRSHPRTAIVGSRVFQGISSFGFAAAAAGGFAAASITLAVGAAAGLLGALWTGSWRSLAELLRLRQIWVIAVVTFLSLVTTAEAYELASVATVSFLLLLVPLFAAAMAPLFAERLVRRELLGMAISLVGMLCFARPSPDFSREWLGILLALLGGALLGLLWHQNRSLAGHHRDPWAASAAQMAVPGLLGLLGLIALGRMPTGVSLAWLLASGLGYAGNSVLRLMALRLLTASRAALIAPVSALTSTALAALLLGQLPDAWTIVGAAVIVAGVVVASYQSR